MENSPSVGEVRIVCSNDLEDLLAIETACFVTDNLSKRQMKYLIHQAKRIFLVIEYASQVIAYAVALLPKLPRPARLYSIAVLPQWCGLGLGKCLLVSLIEAIGEKGYAEFRLEVGQQNKGAIRLYETLGFHPIAYLPNYYLDKTDAMRMSLEFKALTEY